MNDQPAIHGQYAALLVDLLNLNHEQQADLLARCSIRPALLTSRDAYLSKSQITDLIRCVLTESHSPSLGLTFGERLNLMTHGALGQAVLSCNTLEQALELLLKFYQTRMVSADIQLGYEGEHVVLTFDFELDDPESYRFMIETVFVCLVRTSMFFFGMKLMYEGSVQLSYAMPDHMKAYKSTFFEGIEFNAPRNALQFKRELLDLPMAMPNPSALKQAEEACAQVLARLPIKTSLIDQVKSLMFSPTGEQASIEELAAMLHMSSRTLRRKLASKEQSYRKLSEEAKFELASQLLQEGKSIEEIAETLNYSDPSNFGRAFKKRAGVSPSGFRSRC